MTERTPDYLAELLVAGQFAEAGWNVYFPRRDHGFDFVIVKPSSDGGAPIMRPVQVKGKYATAAKTDKAVFGFVGQLSQLHPDMVLAIPYFSVGNRVGPAFVAFMPRSAIKPHTKGYRCEPASFKQGAPVQRRDYAKFFDANGLAALGSRDWR